jgi:thiol-disulfide isomerase/thioredoxin
MKGLKSIARTLIWTLPAVALAIGPAHAQSPEEIPLGSEMPSTSVQLSRVGGGQTSLASLQGSAGTVVVFWSNQCPWVEKYEARLVDIVNEYSGRGFGFVLINSNDPSAYPKEAADQGAQRASGANYPSSLVYLSDPMSDLARAFGAQRTPHVYLFDENNTLVYVGTIDDSPGDAGNVTDRYLRQTLDALLGGSSVPVPKTKAFGCTIKYTS